MSTCHVLVAQVAVAGFEVGTGRTVPSVAALLGLTSVVLGVLALARPARRRAGAVVALVLGLVGLVVGGVHAANAAGGLGTGNGLAGAVVAVVLGLVGACLGGLATRRCRPTG
ncbi:MAG: DUF6223 family protein [Pseudonocardia sp.]